jgi:hypothetical protein
MTKVKNFDYAFERIFCTSFGLLFFIAAYLTYRYGAGEGFTNPGQVCIAFIVGGVFLLRASLANEEEIFLYAMAGFLLALGVGAAPTPLVMSWAYLKMAALSSTCLSLGVAILFKVEKT